MVVDLVFVPNDDTVHTTQMKTEGLISLRDLNTTVPDILQPFFQRGLCSSAVQHDGRVFFTYDVFDMQTEQMVRDTVASVFYMDTADANYPLSEFLAQHEWRILQDLNEFRSGYMRRMRRRVQ